MSSGNEAPTTIVIPVPEKGEIYLRFGDVSGQPLLARRVVAGDTVALPEGLTVPMTPADSAAAAQAATTDAAIRNIIREELARMRGDTVPAQAAPPADIQALQARVDELVRAVAASDRPVVVTPTTVETRVEPVIVQQDAGQRGVREIRPFTGLDLSEYTQLVLGLALDIGPLKPGSSLRLLPTLGLGYGEGPSTMLLHMGLEYRLPVLVDKPRFSIQPMIGFGPSLFKRDSYEAAISTQFATAVRIRGLDGEEKAHVFAALQGVDLFSRARLLVGLRRVR